MKERTDLELVILSRQGNKEAFGCLIERYQVLMERITLHIVSSQEATQDIVQEAMLQAYLSLKDLRKEESFRSWLYGIVLNVSKNYLRDQKKKSRFNEVFNDDQPESLWNPGIIAQDPQQIAIERELHHLVLLAIEELPQAHREAARLYYYELLTLQEITAITGASPGAIKVRLHRARSYLRENLHKAYPEIELDETAKQRRKTMIKVKVADIVKDDEQYIVLLQDEAQKKILPIWVGPSEGAAIAMGLRAFPTLRPMTFDFMVHLLDILGAHLVEVRIEVLRDTVFYGVAKVSIGNEVKEVDARPSDILALAVRIGSPIYVAEEVMQQAGKDKTVFVNEIGQFKPGEAVEAIINEYEEKKKQFLPSLFTEKKIENR